MLGLLEHVFDTLWPTLTPFRCLFGVLWAPLEPLWAPLVTTWATLSTQGWKWGVRTGPKSNLSCNWGSIWESFFQPKWYIFSEKWLPKTSPQSRAICARFLCHFSDPWTLFFELSPARELNFQKNYLDSWKLQKSSPKWSKIGAQRLQNSVRRLKNCICKSIPKKTSKTRAQQWAHTLIATPPPPPETAEGSGLLEAILVRIPYIWAPVANQSAAALG